MLEKNSLSFRILTAIKTAREEGVQISYLWECRIEGANQFLLCNVVAGLLRNKLVEFHGATCIRATEKGRKAVA